MDVLDAVILGIIQGLTEFLPVSSSGHLELAKALFGDTSVPEESLLFTVVLHFATALSTIVVFRKDIIEIVLGLLKFWRFSQFRPALEVLPGGLAKGPVAHRTMVSSDLILVLPGLDGGWTVT